MTSVFIKSDLLVPKTAAINIDYGKCTIIQSDRIKVWKTKHLFKFTKNIMNFTPEREIYETNISF